MTSPPEPPAAAPDAARPTEPTGQPVEPAPRPSRFGKVVVALALLAAIIGVAGARITLPYVIFSPGDATAVDDYRKISDVRTYHHSGSLLLLTVRVSNGRPNVWRFLQASLDDDTKIEGEKDVFGTTPRRTADRQDVQQMQESQLAARQAALTRLGYDVRVTGKGADVQGVLPNSPAATAGLEVGDVITSIDGQPVQLTDDVGTIVRAKPVGTTFSVVARRDDHDVTLPITTA